MHTPWQRQKKNSHKALTIRLIPSANLLTSPLGKFIQKGEHYTPLSRLQSGRANLFTDGLRQRCCSPSVRLLKAIGKVADRLRQI